MNTEIKDFESFYDNKLQPFLADLEKLHDKPKKWLFAIIGFIIIGICCFILEQIFAGVVLISLLLFAVYMYTKEKEKFIIHYKSTIINEIIKFIHPGLVYKPESYISSKEYRASGLYRDIYDNYDGDDHIEGNYRNVNFHCSEIETSYDSLQNVPIQRGGLSNRNLTIFKGLFFVASINHFRGGTYIWTKYEEQLPASVMDEYYRLLPLPKVYKIKVADEEFSKYFSVYSSYPAEAEIVLNAKMIRHMVNFKKQIARNVQFSVVAGKFYVAIPIDEDLLEPDGNADDKEMIKQYFFTILLTLSIINQLQLSRFA